MIIKTNCLMCESIFNLSSGLSHCYHCNQYSIEKDRKGTILVEHFILKKFRVWKNYEQKRTIILEGKSGKCLKTLDTIIPFSENFEEKISNLVPFL